MDINTLMHRIWSTVATPEGVKPEIQLSNDEWQLILEKWPDEYGNTGNVRKSTESTDQLRADWANRKCFYLYGREIRVKVELNEPVLIASEPPKRGRRAKVAA